MIAFSASNIAFVTHKDLLWLRIEGFLLRVRLVIYQLILVSMNQMPILSASLILVLELSHLGIYMYHSIRYRYAKNWLLIISKFNVGTSISIICIFSLYISFSNWEARDFNYPVNSYL